MQSRIGFCSITRDEDSLLYGLDLPGNPRTTTAGSVKPERRPSWSRS